MAKQSNYDFGGYATKCNIRCADGRIIMPDAFAEDDGLQVPLVWNHKHDSIGGVLGHAILENRNDGVFAYCYLNNSQAGQAAREAVRHGDITCLSIFANQLKQAGPEVVHGRIREVSMVLAGANPGAKIEHGELPVMIHADLYEDDAALIWCGDAPKFMSHEDDAALIWCGDAFQSMSHADGEAEKKDSKKDPQSKEETKEDIFNSLSEKQKNVVYEMIGIALDAGKNLELDDEEDETESKKEEKAMKHNLFDSNTDQKNEDVISHDEIMAAINDAKRYGTMSDSFIAHGITNIEYLFPEAQMVGNKTPEWIKRDTGWVAGVLSGVHHTPFSRIKSMFADLREDEARAKGYIKGKLKKEEVFSLLKRTTTPQTIYKKQKLDRDDVIDITDFDVIAWLKSEMRFMLDEEIARAILVGDGRLTSDDDHIKEDCIRPISKDEELYTIQVTVSGSDTATIAKNLIPAAIRGRIGYQGSGSPTLYTTEEMLCEMLLITDEMGRDLYVDEAALARKLRVSKIVTVPVMEKAKGKDEKDLYGIIVNLNDYNVGADRGGAVNMFDDFDIDYNAQKYLIETRCSGALIRPFSAIALVGE